MRSICLASSFVSLAVLVHFRLSSELTKLLITSWCAPRHTHEMTYLSLQTVFQPRPVCLKCVPFVLLLTRCFASLALMLYPAPGVLPHTCSSMSHNVMWKKVFSFFRLHDQIPLLLMFFNFDYGVFCAFFNSVCLAFVCVATSLVMFMTFSYFLFM